MSARIGRLDAGSLVGMVRTIRFACKWPVNLHQIIDNGYEVRYNGSVASEVTIYNAAFGGIVVCLRRNGPLEERNSRS